MNRPRLPLLPALAALPAAVALLSAAGCDTSLDAFKKTDLTYSVFGYLDANADRQQVRVEPLQDSTFVGSGETGSGETGSGEIGARVTSENVETGERVVWEERVSHVGANRVPVHNFTTSADFEPGATYRFRVERASDGAASTARVTLPPAFPEPSLLNPPDLREGSDDEGKSGVTKLLVQGLEHLGAVRVEYDYEECYRPSSCSRRQTTAYHLADTTRRPNGLLEIKIPWRKDIPEGVGAFRRAFYSFRVTVAARSEDWPEYAEDNPPGGGPQGQPLPPPRTDTNIEGGTGFLGGTFTRTVDVPIRR